MTDRAATGDDSGLTLIEMLVVLAIIAVAAGATVLSIAPHRGNSTEAEAQRLAATIQNAADRSIATGARDLLTVDAMGYAIDGVHHPLPPGTTLSSTAGSDLPLAFDSARPFDVVVTAGVDRWVVSFDGLRAVATAAKSDR